MRQAPGPVVASILVALVSAASACAGGKQSMVVLDTDAAVSFISIEATALAGPVQSCPAGAAHPLVCCVGAPRDTATCFEHPLSPFQQCPAGAFAFPDGRTCCPLDGASACTPSVASPLDGSGDAVLDASSGAADAGAPPPMGCSLPCPPGAYPNAAIGFETTTPTCTASDMSLPGTDCLYCCFDTGADGGASCLSNACSCTGKYACSCAPGCPTCPDGWQAPPSGQFDLCCQQAPDGKTSCFSQSSLVQMPG